MFRIKEDTCDPFERKSGGSFFGENIKNECQMQRFLEQKSALKVFWRNQQSGGHLFTCLNFGQKAVTEHLIFGSNLKLGGYKKDAVGFLKIKTAIEFS